jgi:hypothetical protein
MGALRTWLWCPKESSRKDYKLLKALVTGGAGFIGSTIAKELASNGADVVVLANLSSGYRININGQPGIRLVEKDIRDSAAVDAAVAGVDAIFHLAVSVDKKRSINQTGHRLGDQRDRDAAEDLSDAADLYGKTKFLGQVAQPPFRRGFIGLSVMKLILALALAFAAANGARAEDFVFETRVTRLVIRPDAVVSSLIEKQNGKERLRPEGQAFAAVRKGGRLFPASAADRHGDMLHVTFGTSGVDAEYRITALADYIVVELTAFHGDGIEEIRLMQLNVSLANAGGVLGVRWDDEFAVCLMGLSARVDSKIAGQVMLASVYPEFSMRGERVAIIAAPTPRFLEVVRKVEQDFRLPSPTLGGTWAKLSEDVRTSYLFTDLTEANADETIRYAKLGGFRYILVYSQTWSASLGSYPINTRNFPRGEESLKAVIDKCHAAGLRVGMHMLTSFVGKNDPLVRPKPSPWLLKDAEATLARDLSETVTELAAASALAGFPMEDGPYGPANAL